MTKTYIGIDNGVTGSIGIIDYAGAEMFKTPTITQQSYTKKKQNISRLDFFAFKKIIDHYETETIKVLIERPFLNPGGLKASISAARCLEAQLIVIELTNLPYQYIDSRLWQRELLPQGIKGTAELKKASLDIGIRLFPHLKDNIRKHKDADGLLIAEWARRNNL